MKDKLGARNNMLLDLESYRVQKQEIIRAYEMAKVKDVQEVVSLCGPGIHTPLAVLCYYLSEHLGGFTPELTHMTSRLISFYGYLSIKGCPETSPDFGLKRV